MKAARQVALHPMVAKVAHLPKTQQEKQVKEREMVKERLQTDKVDRAIAILKAVKVVIPIVVGQGDGDGGDSQEQGEGGADGAGQGKGDGDGSGDEGNCDNCSGESDSDGGDDADGDSGEDGDSSESGEGEEGSQEFRFRFR